ncbi:MAG: hypothetical protein AB7R89_26025 [Dehalococcoidia bacterium]
MSLSWAVAVDLTPASARPYIGSSDSNSAIDLILGYNGLDRLLGRGRALRRAWLESDAECSHTRM